MPNEPLIVSVSGLRGVVGQSLTAPVAAQYAACFGQWLKQAPGGCADPHVLLARDGRVSGQMLELAAAAGLIGTGCRVTQIGIVSTPGAAVMTTHLAAHGAMVVTASHNPSQWNGLKALRRDGCAPGPDEARQIRELFDRGATAHTAAESLAPLEADDGARRVHVGRVVDQVDATLIRAGRFRVVVDSVHGAGGPETALLAERLGVELIQLHGEPTGRFPHPPEPTADNLGGLCEQVVKYQAHAGFAQDPDADRLAIVDETGHYVGEEYTLALSCLHAMSRPSSQGAAPPPVVATNLSTSRMIDDVVSKHGGRVVRTPVGEAHVVEAMREHGALIGGEGNGGVILPAVCFVRDSLAGIALILELLAARRQKLSTIISEIPSYAIVKDRIDAPQGPAQDHLRRLAGHYGGSPGDARTDLQDGVRIDWPDRWVHARPSNTEPIWRIIAEAPAETTAREMIAQVRHVLGP